MPTRGATSHTIARAAIAVVLSATLVADQSAPVLPAPPPAPPGYVEAWAVPVETAGPLVLAAGQHAVFVAYGDSIAAHGKADGKLLWTHPRSGVTQLLASSRAGAPLAGVAGTDVFALDPGTGDVRWTATLAGSADRTYLAAFQRDGLMVASGTSVRAYRRDGTVAWSASIGAAATTPAVTQDGAAWIGTEAPSLVRLDGASGSLLSQTPVASPPQAIVTAPGEAYVVGTAPVLALYRAGEMQPSWQWKPKRGLAGTVGAPVVGEELVFVTALDNTLQAFDRGGGAVRWRQPLPSRPAPGLSEFGGFLVVPLITGAVVRLSPVDGAKAPFGEMKLETDARIQAFQMDAEGAVFLVTFSARTQALTAWRRAAPAKSPQPPSRPRPAF